MAARVNTSGGDRQFFFFVQSGEEVWRLAGRHPPWARISRSRKRKWPPRGGAPWERGAMCEHSSARMGAFMSAGLVRRRGAWRRFFKATQHPPPVSLKNARAIAARYRHTPQATPRFAVTAVLWK